MVKTLKSLFLSLYLVTILDPYKDLNYNQINIYDYTMRNEIATVEAHEPEKEVEEPTKEVNRFWCFICKPQQWVEF